jgi:hypothetical protein
MVSAPVAVDLLVVQPGQGQTLGSPALVQQPMQGQEHLLKAKLGSTMMHQ